MANGFETWRQLVTRFSIPAGARSIRYLTKLLKPSFDDKKLKNNLQLGNLRSTGVKETATPSYQTTSRLQRFSTKPVEHFSNIYSLQHPMQLPTNRSEPSLRNTTEQRHHSQEPNNSTTHPTKMTKVQRQWTSEQQPGKERANQRARKDTTNQKKQGSNTRKRMQHQRK